MKDDARLLAAALLWLRNHYEDDKERDPRVLKRVDRILNNNPVSVADMENLRTRYSS